MAAQFFQVAFRHRAEIDLFQPLGLIAGRGHRSPRRHHAAVVVLSDQLEGEAPPALAQLVHVRTSVFGDALHGLFAAAAGAEIDDLVLETCLRGEETLFAPGAPGAERLSPALHVPTRNRIIV